ncbi:STAS domain-containing protein [Streptomyces sp. NPDC005423]|uniref:STAS domain-containing protein n=1 Tax=Streptomyces sp. NPDC005423 TaxID=3155343 RepID=UPI0033A36B14
MALPRLNVHRRDHDTRALIILAGEMDVTTAPLLGLTLATCARDGIRTVDVDATALAFCDVSGLNAFLAASRLATDAGTTLRLHHPPPIMARLIEITGSGSLLDERHAARPSSPRVPLAVAAAVRGDSPALP